MHELLKRDPNISRIFTYTNCTEPRVPADWLIASAVAQESHINGNTPDHYVIY